ncbi:MAG: hypothetical protein KAU17_06515 [Spirochaetales bacterium]|nr:hypothetical protein [Spirochaetales bacterium]
MSEKTVFQELSKTLPEQERKDLLSRITQSISLSESQVENVYHKEIGQEEKIALIKQDLSQISWFSNMILWFLSTFTGKKKEEVYLQRRMGAIKRKIQHKYPGLTGFETRDLTPKLAHEVFELYSLTIGLRGIFRTLWLHSSKFESLFLTLLELHIKEPKKSISELISMDEMVSIYRETGLKDSIRMEIQIHIDEYLNELPDSLFTELETGIIPLYLLKELVLFPYASFFKMFHFTPLPDDTNKPAFQSASAMVALEYLEKLYYALYTASKIGPKFTIESDLLVYLSQLEVDESADGSPVFMSDVLIKQKLSELHKEAMDFLSNIPIVELIQYFRKDPYYRLIFYIPKLNLRDFYHSMLTVNFLSQADKIFPEIQELYIDQEIQELFNEKQLVTFRYYRKYASIDYEKMGLPFFFYTQPLNLIYNYIKWYYREHVQELVQILERGVLAQNRITRDRVLHHVGMLEDIEDKINQFDISLSPDAEDGKLFQRLRYSLAQDSTHQKMYRTLVAQKDREVKSHMDRGAEAIEGLGKVFREIISTSSQSIRMQLGNHYLVKGKPVSLISMLKTHSAHMEQFLKLLRQILKFERT